MHCCSRACRDLEGLCNDKTPIGNAIDISAHAAISYFLGDFSKNSMKMLYIVMCNGSQKSCCMHAGCYFNTKISIYMGRTIGKAICNMDQTKDNLERYGFYSAKFDFCPDLTPVFWPFLSGTAIPNYPLGLP